MKSTEEKTMEWELALKNGKIVEIKGKKYFQPFSGRAITLNYFIKSLLASSQDSFRRKVEEELDKMFPFSFSNDMGSYREAVRGVPESDHLRQMTKSEGEIVEKIKQIIKTTK